MMRWWRQLWCEHVFSQEQHFHATRQLPSAYVSECYKCGKLRCRLAY